MTRIAILGTGMSALGAAHRLRAEPRIPCCTTRTRTTAATRHAEVSGRVQFDIGPHVSFTKDERIQELFAESVDGAYETHDTSS